VSFKPRPWQLIVLIALLCGLSVWGVIWYRSLAMTPTAMLRRMPWADAMVVYVDFQQLRRAGILQLLDGTKGGEDPEYQAFVQKTRLDYKRDLDTAMVAFAPSGKLLLVRGRFDWKSLRSYVESQQGSCDSSLCRVTGSSPERRISFFPMRQNLMALAVSVDDSAALRLNTVSPPPDLEIPDAPVWLSASGSVLQSVTNLPTGTRTFARSMERAQSITIAFVPEGGRLAARLSLRCRTAQDASEITSELSETTRLLKSLIAREHQTPSPADLSGVLTSGTFRAEGAKVSGYWPIERVFVERLLGP
jgi:hypothetical protein